LAAEKKFGKKPGKVAFMMARDGRLIFLTIDDKNRTYVVNKLVDTTTKMNAGQYTPTPSEKVCGDCLYNLQCKSSMRGYSTQSTMNFGDLLDGKVN
jgi:CRISPR/Cas system-associated exonuclease Cas4 (RecB family)